MRCRPVNSDKRVGLALGFACNWKVVFYVGGLVPLLIVPLLGRYLPESAEFQAGHDPAAAREKVWHGLFHNGAGPATLLLWLSYFFTLMVVYILINWLPSLLVGQGYDARQASWVMLALQMGAALGTLALGALMDRLPTWAMAALIYVGILVALAALGLASAFPAMLMTGFVAGLLPYDPATKEPNDEYAELGLTAKMKVSKTELQAGTISTLLPIMFASPSRLLPQTLRGTYLRSEDLDNFTLHLGWLDRMNQRDSTNYQRFTVAAPNGRFNGKAESDQFLFFGTDWRWSDALTLKYYHASLQDLYRKDFFGFEHIQVIGAGKLKSDVRYFITGDDGAASAGPVDNRNLAGMFSYAIGAHTFAAGYMHLSGDSAMPYVAGTEPLVITEGSLSSEFINADERSWQVKYDYDFSGVGVPGLKGMLRYIDGSNIKLPTALGGDDRHERETDVEVSYVVQSGSFKGVGLRVRHAWYRNDFAPQATFRDGNELRVNVDYTIALW